MKLNFDSPDSVSNSRDGSDKINFKIVDMSLFESKESGKMINSQKMPNNIISKDLPPIIADPAIS